MVINGLKKGYMTSFNFNKKKETGVKEIGVGDKVLVEAVVQKKRIHFIDFENCMCYNTAACQRTCNQSDC